MIRKRHNPTEELVISMRDAPICKFRVANGPPGPVNWRSRPPVNQIVDNIVAVLVTAWEIEDQDLWEGGMEENSVVEIRCCCVSLYSHIVWARAEAPGLFVLSNRRRIGMKFLTVGDGFLIANLTAGVVPHPESCLYIGGLANSGGDKEGRGHTEFM
jgi:hypothetical protein